jgi:hypothetical protein
MRVLVGLLMLTQLCLLANAADQLRCPARVTHMKMDRGSYSPLPGAVFDLQAFDADMVARGKTAPLCFARTTEVRTGEVFVSSESLTRLFAQKIQQSNSKVSDINLEVKDDKTVHLSGKLHKKVAIPFEIEGPVSTNGRDLILAAKKIKAGDIPIKGLLGMVGENLAKLLGSESVSGVVAQGNSLIFQLSKIANVEGRIARADLTPKGLNITFEAVQNHSSARLRRAQ